MTRCSICLTKLDILDDFDEVKVGVAYKIDGAPVEGMPCMECVLLLSHALYISPSHPRSGAGAATCDS